MRSCREGSSSGGYFVTIEPLSGLRLTDEVNPARVFHLLEFSAPNSDLSSCDLVVLNKIIMAYDLPDWIVGLQVPHDPQFALGWGYWHVYRILAL